MSWQTIQNQWLLVFVLIALGYLLATTVWLVMACQYRHAIFIHDRIRDSKALRQRYLDALKPKDEAPNQTP